MKLNKDDLASQIGHLLLVISLRKAHNLGVCALELTLEDCRLEFIDRFGPLEDYESD